MSVLTLQCIIFLSADLPKEGQSGSVQATWCGWLAGWLAGSLAL